jgi:hypothetical protein
MFTEGISYQKTITMITVECCSCGVVFGMPSDLNERFMNDPSKYFYCPNGHNQHYSKSKEQRLREEAERKLQQKENELANLASTKIQLEGQLKKANSKLKRVQNGVCPCCNRTFKDLAAHMKTKHPELKK